MGQTRHVSCWTLYYVDVSLLTEREVWLQKSIHDAEGIPVVDEATGRTAKDTVKVMPAQIKEVLDLARKEYLGNRERQPLDFRVRRARGIRRALRGRRPPPDVQARWGRRAHASPRRGIRAAGGMRRGASHATDLAVGAAS